MLSNFPVWVLRLRSRTTVCLDWAMAGMKHRGRRETREQDGFCTIVLFIYRIFLTSELWMVAYADQGLLYARDVASDFVAGGDQRVLRWMGRRKICFAGGAGIS